MVSVDLLHHALSQTDAPRSLLCACAQADDPDGAWEEKYNSHTDSKARASCNAAMLHPLPLAHRPSSTQQQPKGPQSLSVDITFPGARHVYGLPEHASSFSLKRTRAAAPSRDVLSEPYRLYNLDVYEYLPDSPFGLYGSIPVLLAHSAGPQGPPRTSAVFWLNSAEQYVDLSDSVASQGKGATGGVDAHWFAESGLIDLFLMPGPTPADVWKTYASLTGPPMLPPLFSLGYHQCRWNYKDEADAEAVDAGFDAHDMPYDVIWLDIEHTDGKRYMTWHPTHFPTPARLQDAIASRGRKTVTIIDPHVKRDDGYPMHVEATRLGLYVKSADGSKDFEGWCWPGSSSYLDVSDPRVRSWWADQFSLDKYAGSTPNLHVWNDMNEPSVFNGPEVTMQKDLKHSDGWEHRDVHNAYGAWYHQATVEGLAKRSPQQRPFVLSRAFFAGSQRFGAIWTGDNAAEWSHLAVSVPMVLSISIAGMPFVGADVGGFFGNPSPELLVRWYQLGTYYPFFRGHAHHETQRREPWLMGEPHTGHIQAALRERYALLPSIYTLFAQSAGATASTARTGVPVALPLWAEFPGDEAAAGVGNQLLLGPHLLVCPAVTPDVTAVNCYLPGVDASTTAWYNTLTGAPHAGKATVAVPAPMQGPAPSYLRAGAILPRRERPRRDTAAQGGDPYTLVVALAADGTARGELYLDDGSSNAHRSGQSSTRLFTASPAPGGGIQVVGAGLGKQAYACDDVIERVVVLGLPGASAEEWAATAFQGAAGDVALQGAGTSLGALLPGPVFTNSPGAQEQVGAARVVRQPRLRVAGDWTLVLSRGPAGKTATA